MLEKGCDPVEESGNRVGGGGGGKLSGPSSAPSDTISGPSSS